MGQRRGNDVGTGLRVVFDSQSRSGIYSVAILVSEILDIVSPKDFGMT